MGKQIIFTKNALRKSLPITGDSNGNQPFLYVDKLVGGVNFCIGLRIDDKIGQYVPVSALQRNIKELTDKPSQVLAIFERNYGDTSVFLASES